MANITRCPPWRHLRSGPNHHVLLFRNGKLTRSGRGLSFWFYPLWSSVAEIPCDDRDQPFVFQGRSRDHQDVTVQGTITYRVTEPEELARHIDFTIDVNSGLYLMTPLEQLSERLTQLAQQLAWDYLNQTPLRELLVRGLDQVRLRIRKGLESDANLGTIGLQIVSVQVADLSPSSDLEKALQAPTREAIQQDRMKPCFTGGPWRWKKSGRLPKTNCGIASNWRGARKN
jgi:regulator of protease activity HflC (stomatin/prohibitin superfamily)